MSSIRIYILGALADEGDMHGHQLRQLAEQEHIDQWTDVSVGALYGAIKRLAAEGLIEEVRTEQVGGYPERVIWRITPDGRSALRSLRLDALGEVVNRADPFDLAIARPDVDALAEIPAVVQARVANLRTMLEDSESHTRRISRYLSDLEVMVMRHRADRLRAEIAWHDDLLERLPALLDDHDRNSRKEHHS
jgi:DNA-binding PadR family transcriptional regulator